MRGVQEQETMLGICFALFKYGVEYTDLRITSVECEMNPVTQLTLKS